MAGENQPRVVTVLQAALIHNGDAKRLAHIRPGLASIGAGLAGKADFEVREIFEQPPVRPQPWAQFLRRRAAAWRVQRQWKRYLEQEPLPGPVDALRLPRDLLANHDRRRATIESILTDKHVAAWRGFVASRATLLMVLEDDAVMREDTVAGMREALAMLDASGPSQPAYIDLAGGIDQSSLGLVRLVADLHGRFIEYRKPASNTAGGYLMNRTLAEAMVALLDSHPDWLLLPADWLINRCFLELADRGQVVRCLHAEPTIFVHGSHWGTYSSTVN